MRLLFLLAWAARVATMPMLAHWGIILGMLLIGVPMDWAADYTLFGTVVLGIGSLFLIVTLRRDGRVAARISLGPDKLLRHSMAVIGVAMASSVGGLLLLMRGSGPAALWAMGLGTFVAVCETSALVGSIFVSTLESQARMKDR